eukprot:Rmarinus@m.15719
MEIEFPAVGDARYELKSDADSAFNDLCTILLTVARRGDPELLIRNFVTKHLGFEGFDASIAESIVELSTLVPPTQNLIIYPPEGGKLECISHEAFCIRGTTPLTVCSISQREDANNEPTCI